VKLVPAVDRSVAVVRGPLVYALPIPASSRTVKSYPVRGFADQEFTPTAAARWDYALQSLGDGLPTRFTRSHEQVTAPGAAADPWRQPPIAIRVTALDARSAAPDSGDNWLAPGETELDLVPMGCTVLRRTCFPLVERPPRLYTDPGRESAPAAHSTCQQRADLTGPGAPHEGQDGAVEVTRT